MISTSGSPTISVVVPTYNDSIMLVSALESLQKQIFSDFEVIVGDDASTNDTPVLAKEFCTGDKRFRFIRYEQNAGMTRHWNRVFKEARGQYVCKLDGDDAYQPHVLEKLFESLQQQNASIAFCRTIDCNDRLEPVASYYGERALIRHGIEPLLDHCRRGLEWYKLCFDGYQLWHSNAFLMERQLMERTGGWDVRFGCCADTDLILRLLEQNQKVCHCAYPGVLYRRRNGSVLDTFRTNAWSVLESAVVHLSSLNRVTLNHSRLGFALRRQWVRYWNNYEQEHLLAAAGKRDFTELEAAAIQLAPPPVSYRMIERVRNAAKRTAQLFRGHGR